MSLTYSSCIADTDELARALMPNCIAIRCNFCWQATESGVELKRCCRCSFAYYCNAECQAKAWKEHRKECQHLSGKLEKWRSWPPKYQLTGSTESATFRMDALLLFRLLLKRDSGEFAAASGKYSGKTFADLIASCEPIVEIGDVRLERAKFLEIVDIQHCASFLHDEQLDDDTAVEYCKKIWNNGISFNVEESQMIGVCLFLDVADDSNCQPNASVTQVNQQLRIIPLPGADGRPIFDAHNIAELRMGASNLLTTKGVRRASVQRGFLFSCECERCVGSEDDFLSAIVCQQCGSPIPIDDSAFRHSPRQKFENAMSPSPSLLKRIQRALPDSMNVREMLIATLDRSDFDCFGPALQDVQAACSACGTAQSKERIEFAFAMMTVVDHVSTLLPPPSQLSQLNRFEKECAKILPDCNLYRARLHGIMSNDEGAELSERADRALKWYNVAKKCVPRGHLKLRSSLAKVCKALVEAKRCDELRAVLADYVQILKIVKIAMGTDLESIASNVSVHVVWDWAYASLAEDRMFLQGSGTSDLF